MALVEESGGVPATMLVGPTGYNGGGFGNGFGGDGWWIILLFILLAGGGWNNGGWGGNGGGMPIVVNEGGFAGNAVQRGFDQAAVMGGLNDITAGIFGVQSAISNGFAQAEIAANSRQMADMNQMFNLSTQFSNCCCENRLGLANLGADIAREACADRAAVANGIRDVLSATQAQTQTILDKLFQQEIDNLKAQNIALQNQVNMQNLAASQAAQTAALVADNTAQTQYIVNRIAPYPTPAYIVQNPATSASCGCGGF